MNYNNVAPQYNNNNNQRFGGKNETTSGFCLDNANAAKFLNFNLWNKTVQLEIGTCPAGAPMIWDVKKNAQKISQNISFGGLVDLCAICEEVLDKLKNTGNFEPVGIKAGAKLDSIVEISNGSNINMPAGLYLVIYKSIDSGNRTAVAEVYPFKSSKFLRNYDHNTGSYVEDNIKIGDFKKFYRGIMEASKAFTMAQAHAVSDVKKGDKLAIFAALSAITSGLGIELIDDSKDRKPPSGNYNNNNNYQQKSYGGPSSYGGGGARNGTFEPGNGTNFQRQQEMFASIVDDPVDMIMDIGEMTNVGLAGFN